MWNSAQARPAPGPQPITPPAAAVAAARADGGREAARRGGAGRAARPHSFLWGAGHGGTERPQAELGGAGGSRDNGFHLKGAAGARAAGGGGWKD